MDRREAIKSGIIALGGTLSVSSLPAIISACSGTETQGTDVFTGIQIDVLKISVDRIIPETGTPSASQTGVLPFIEVVLKECFPSEKLEEFKSGLDVQVENKFMRMDAERQDEYLTQLETDGSPFFKILKQLTLIGYFSSEEGMKQNFDYKPVPGKYEGCIDFDPEKGRWIGNRL